MLTTAEQCQKLKSLKRPSKAWQRTAARKTKIYPRPAWLRERPISASMMLNTVACKAETYVTMRQINRTGFHIIGKRSSCMTGMCAGAGCMALCLQFSCTAPNITLGVLQRRLQSSSTLLSDHSCFTASHVAPRKRGHQSEKLRHMISFPLVGGFDWFGFGFEALLLVEGKWDTPRFHHQTTDSAPNQLAASRV